jgi:uncharacterized membrane protein
LGVIAARAAVGGAAEGISYPRLRGLIPQVVDGPQLQSANALIRLAQNSTSLIGASVSGLLVVGLGAGWGLAVDAVPFLLSAGFVLTSRAPRAPAPARPGVAREHYGGALAWSVIITAQAVGPIAGSLVAMRLRPAFPLLVGTLATFAFVPPLVLLAFHAPVWLAAVSMLGIGAAIDVYEVLWLTVLQEHIPSEKLSRVSSWDALGAFALGPVGLVLVGPLPAVVGIQGTYIGAAGLVTIAIVAALLTPSVRRLPARPQPADDGEAMPGPGPTAPSAY